MSDQLELQDAATVHEASAKTVAGADWSSHVEAVFLCGFPSSGTDLLKNIVNAHTEVFVGGEFPLLPRLAKRYEASVPLGQCRDVWEALRGIDVYRNFDDAAEKECPIAEDSLFLRLFAELLVPKAERQGVRWVGNKTPQNTEHIDELNDLFPTAKFILILRDVRDVALSWKSKWGKDPLLCAAKWNRRMLAGINKLRMLGTERYLFLKYEDLLLEPERIERRICDFLGLEFQSRMLEFSRYVGSIVDGKLNYGQPILANNFGKWRERMEPDLIRRIEEVAYDGLNEFDYGVTSATNAIGLTRVENLQGRLVDVWSTVFFGNRAIKGSQLRHRLQTIRVELAKKLPLRK